MAIVLGVFAVFFMDESINLPIRVKAERLCIKFALLF